jgi:ADP-ribose pyrophosphatase
MRVVDVEVEDCELFGRGGFAQLRRCRAVNIRRDGSRSGPYILDLVEREIGADAVAVLPYEVSAGGVRVLIRRGLRPALRLARAGEPTREAARPPIDHLELVAGILERDDEGNDGLRLRAAAELAEEAGLRVDPARVEMLGPPFFLSPGLTAERIYLCCVSTPLGDLSPPKGDGSRLEEGGEAVIYTLQQALDECASGVIQDAKTEVALRRLEQQLEHEG